MKLTSSELRVLLSLESDRKRNRFVVICVAVAIGIYTALRFGGVIEFHTAPLDNLVLGMGAVLLGASLNNNRQQEKYRKLLARFSNNDSETIAALSSSKATSNEAEAQR